MRAFIAIDLPEDTRDAMSGLQTRLRAAVPDASWVKPENFHLTLRFLGEISARQSEDLIRRLRVACTECPRVTLCFGGAGAFPTARRPSVLWAGLRCLSGDLGRLQSAAENAARAIGLEPESRRFHPHVTLARVRDPRKTGDVTAILEDCAAQGADAFEVRHVALWSSQLHPGGSIYRRIEEFALQ